MSLEKFGIVFGLVASIIICASVLVKIFKWWRNRGKQGEEIKTPEIILEYNNNFRPNKSGDIVTYFLNVKNVGEVVAKDVEIRLYKVEQISKVTHLEDRYILHRFDYIKVGDSHPFIFISDYQARPDLSEHLRTPAGRGRIFPRGNGIYTFHISGSNFPLITQQLIMLWNEDLGRYDIRNYKPIKSR